MCWKRSLVTVFLLPTLNECLQSARTVQQMCRKKNILEGNIFRALNINFTCIWFIFWRNLCRENNVMKVFCEHGFSILFFGFVQELVRDGLRFPTTGLDNPSTVSSILLQQPGKLKAKQIREGWWLDVIQTNWPFINKCGRVWLLPGNFRCLFLLFKLFKVRKMFQGAQNRWK